MCGTKVRIAMSASFMAHAIGRKTQVARPPMFVMSSADSSAKSVKVKELSQPEKSG